ncbi:MAG TPA: glycosyltransferase family 4 protein [Methanomassiliicoccaceae archaeon]|nr:glycosyltransferase family 4 protein [Methanomassiliicoccaceae archaeon]
MRIGLVNLITKTADLQADGSVLSARLNVSDDSQLNIVEMARRLNARGHDVTVFVSDAYRPQRPTRTDVRIEYLPTRLSRLFPPSLAPLTPSLPRRLREERLDVVQSGEVFQPGTVLTWPAARRARMFVWQELDVLMRGPAGWGQKSFYSTLGRGIARHCEAIIPRSLSARSHLVEHGIPEEKMAPVVHSGVDTMIYRPMNKSEARSRFGIEEDRNVILSVGRLHHNKGMDRLVGAMRPIRATDPDALLIIKGVGPEEGNLRRMVADGRLEENVWVMTDFLDRQDMAMLYNCADVLAVASRIDLFPFTAIEAISCGVPIATAFGRGLRSDIVEKGAGMMLRQGQDDMARDLLELLDDPVRLEIMGRNARELALRDFDHESMADRLVEIYGGEA